MATPNKGLHHQIRKVLISISITEINDTSQLTKIFMKIRRRYYGLLWILYRKDFRCI